MPNNNTEWPMRFPPREPIDPEFAKIEALSQIEIARLQRFAPSGHPWFDSSKPYYEILAKRFKELGGMTPEISKRIGWDK